MAAKTIRRQKLRSSTAWTTAVTLGLLLGVTLFVGRAVRLVEVPSKSMLPTLEPGDVVMMRIDAYRSHLPQRGDIIVFHDKSNGELLIKRVIGRPGDSVTAWSGLVWLNGKRLKEPYAIGRLILEMPETVILKDDEVWVMGDNRDFSNDSRDYGPVKRPQLVGRAEAIIWPADRRGALTP